MSPIRIKHKGQVPVFKQGEFVAKGPAETRCFVSDKLLIVVIIDFIAVHILDLHISWAKTIFSSLFGFIFLPYTDNVVCPDGTDILSDEPFVLDIVHLFPSDDISVVVQYIFIIAV